MDEPTERLPQQPLINCVMSDEFDTLVVEMPTERESLANANRQLLSRPSQPAEVS